MDSHMQSQKRPGALPPIPTAVAKRQRDSKSASAPERFEPECRRPQLIDSLVALPAFMYAFQTGLMKLETIFRSPSSVFLGKIAPYATEIRFSSQIRLLLMARSRLCTVLVQRLLYFPRQRPVRYPVRHATAILSRRHQFPATCVATLPGHSGSIWSLAVHPSGSVVCTGSSYGSAKLWRLSSDLCFGTCVSTLVGTSELVRSVAFHPSGSVVCTGSTYGSAKLWRLSSDLCSGTCVGTLHGSIHGFSSGSINSVVFNPSGSVVCTGCEYGVANLWRLSSDLCSGTCVATLAGHSSSVNSVAFHPSGLILCTGSDDGRVKLWQLSSDLYSGTCVGTLAGHSSSVRSVVFHPSGRVVCTGSKDGTANLWRLSSDLCSGTCVATLAGHMSRVDSVAFHPCGLILCTGSKDTTAKLWRLSSDFCSVTCVGTLEGHSSRIGPRAVSSVAFHPSCGVVFTGSSDDAVRLWR